MSAHDDLGSPPLHELPARVADRARELAGDGLTGLYLTDIDGACLLWLAGDEALPPRLGVAGAVGPELDSAAVARIERDVLEATGGDIRDDATQLLLALD